MNNNIKEFSNAYESLLKDLNGDYVYTFDLADPNFESIRNGMAYLDFDCILELDTINYTDEDISRYHYFMYNDPHYEISDEMYYIIDEFNSDGNTFFLSNENSELLNELFTYQDPKYTKHEFNEYLKNEELLLRSIVNIYCENLFTHLSNEMVKYLKENYDGLFKNFGFITVVTLERYKVPVKILKRLFDLYGNPSMTIKELITSMFDEGLSMVNNINLEDLNYFNMNYSPLDIVEESSGEIERLIQSRLDDYDVSVMYLPTIDYINKIGGFDRDIRASHGQFTYNVVDVDHDGTISIIITYLDSKKV